VNWDVLVPLFAYLLLMAGIGAWAYAQRLRVSAGHKTEQYYLGGRSLGWVVLVFTLLASAASAGTFIGGPGLGYSGGYGWILVSMFQVPTAFVVFGLLGKKFAILSRKLRIVTVTGFLRHRYEHPAVSVLASIGIVGFLMAYMVAQFVGGARILEAITGVSYTVLIVVFAGVVTLYTAFGGFLADAISDTVQGIIMLLGGVALWVAVLSVTGGLGDVGSTLQRNFPDLLLLPGPDGFTAEMIASYSAQLGLLFCVLPHLAVRAMAYRDSKAMHMAMATGPLLMFVITLGFLLMGPVGRLFYPNLEVGDLAVPQMIVDLLPGPVAGTLLAAPLAAIMSTVDSMILIVSGAIVRDLYVEYIRPQTSDQTISRASTGVSVVMGVVVLLLALDPPAYLEYLIIFAIGGLEAVFFVPLVLGLYWRRGNTAGAILAMIGGMTWYIVATQWVTAMAFGVFPIVPSTVLAVLLYVAAAYIGPPPSRTVLVKFWGTQAEIDKLAASRQPVGSR
jgi:sodium/pantothenate symporter